MTKHLNCCQKVLLDFCDELDLDVKTARNIGAGFGSGACAGELCGALSGGIMAIGLKYSDSEEVSSRDMVCLFESKFLEKYGTLRCKDLLGYDFSIDGEKDKAREDGILAEKCPLIIDDAKKILRDIGL